MSLKRVLETLAGLGFSQSDANVYIFLAKKGPHRGKDLCTTLNMPKPFLYQCLSRLKNIGAVTATPERPAQFSAVPFEKVLELLIKSKVEEAQSAQRDKEKALSDWKLITSNDDSEK
jgi:sugar-specific transcriptional regulator TrmB